MASLLLQELIAQARRLCLHLMGAMSHMRTLIGACWS